MFRSRCFHFIDKCVYLVVPTMLEWLDSSSTIHTRHLQIPRWNLQQHSIHSHLNLLLFYFYIEGFKTPISSPTPDVPTNIWNLFFFFSFSLHLIFLLLDNDAFLLYKIKWLSWKIKREVNDVLFEINTCQRNIESIKNTKKKTFPQNRGCKAKKKCVIKYTRAAPFFFLILGFA